MTARTPRAAARGRPTRSSEELAFQTLWLYANALALHQWLHFWSRLFPRDVTDEELSLWLIMPSWVTRHGIGRLARLIYAVAPARVAVNLVGRRLHLQAHQIRWLLKRARRLYPRLFDVIYHSSVFAWYLHGARQMGIRARPRAAAARRLADKIPEISRHWHEQTRAHFPPADVRVRQALGDLLPDDEAVNARRYAFALHYAEACVRGCIVHTNSRPR